MSELARQIRECMSGLTRAEEGKLRARFVFPAGFVGFQGHFPGRPVLPAVCEIQAALEMVAAWNGRRIRLDEIVLAKFASPVTCDEEVDCLCSVTMEDSQRAVVRANVTREGENVAKFRLRVTLEGERQGCA